MQSPSSSSPALLSPDPLESPPAGPQVCPPAKGHVTGGDGHVGNAQRAQGPPAHLPASSPGCPHPMLY